MKTIIQNNSEKQINMPEIKKVNVDIFGSEYTLKSQDTTEEYLIMLANYVDSKMRDLSRQFNKKISLTQLAVLTALNIADELFQERNKTVDEELIVSKTKQLIQLLEEGILGDPVV